MPTFSVTIQGSSQPAKHFDIASGEFVKIGRAADNDVVVGGCERNVYRGYNCGRAPRPLTHSNKK